MPLFTTPSRQWSGSPRTRRWSACRLRALRYGVPRRSRVSPAGEGGTTFAGGYGGEL
jgi:hypothetical protein